MEFGGTTHQINTETDWLSGHQRPWIFERILFVAEGVFAEQMHAELERSLYTMERVRTSVDALKRIIQSEFEVVLCQLSPEFPAEMFYRGVERVRPYLTRRLLFFIDAQTDPAVLRFVRNMKIATIWYPSEPHIIVETITGVVRKTTSMTDMSVSSQVKVVKTIRSSA